MQISIFKIENKDYYSQMDCENFKKWAKKKLIQNWRFLINFLIFEIQTITSKMSQNNLICKYIYVDFINTLSLLLL